ncbi:sialic acid synthase-like [Uloborus diversus]|uniref:sialic acid synthase-like n=1 Tax=Uloborus diversus TaxID=327109 RepID=UPI002409E9DF|nr:sialic acid synthase-like [Uloborus diversus]
MSACLPELPPDVPTHGFQIAPGRYIGEAFPCFIIAEVGQNHNGDMGMAKNLISLAVDCGADCVKFQKTDVKSRFTKSVYTKPYSGRNSFGKTYGEHRENIELTEENFIELSKFAEAMGIYFTASGMDKPSIDFLNEIDVPFFKIGSADCNNIPLLRHACKYRRPLIVSTGMSSEDTVCTMYHEVLAHQKYLAILHCTSTYPTPPNKINLNVIKRYKELFPRAVIGYSGHEVGIDISVAAVAAGAKVLERHITFDHDLPGSDHIASLEPEELKNLVCEVRLIEEAMGSPKKQVQDCELPCYNKLGKTVVASRYIAQGTIIEEDMLEVKVAEKKGWDPIKFYDLVGRKLNKDVEEDEVIQREDVA